MEYLPENRRKLVEEAIGILQQLRSEAGRGSSENSQTSQPASNFSDQQHSLSASSGPRHRRLNSLPHLSVVDRGDGTSDNISEQPCSSGLQQRQQNETPHRRNSLSTMMNPGNLFPLFPVY